MSIDSRALLRELASHAARLGVFGEVNTHEPKSAPHPTGRPSAHVFLAGIAPATRVTNSLTHTSVVVTGVIRVYVPMLQEPQDDIDPAICGAVDAVMNSVSGEFTLGGLVDEVDLLGIEGQPMAAQFGHLPLDKTMFRVADVFVPMAIHDVWERIA